MFCSLSIGLYSMEVCRKVVASYIRLECRTFCVTVSRYLREKELEKLIAFAYDKFSFDVMPTLPINVQFSYVRRVQVEILCNAKNRSPKGGVRSRCLKDPTFFLGSKEFSSCVVFETTVSHMCITTFTIHAILRFAGT
jgi:hypothetical protein